MWLRERAGDLGLEKGTPVAIYMGMVPELPIAMLACARLGAPHTVVFGGFSAESLSDRMNDMECELLITQDEGWRAGKKVPLKRNADEAVAQAPTVRNVVVLRRTGDEVPFDESRDAWWHELTEGQDDDLLAPPRADGGRRLLYLYTSGTTAKPRASFTRPRATSSGSPPRTTTSSTSSRTRCTGARPTSAG